MRKCTDASIYILRAYRAPRDHLLIIPGWPVTTLKFSVWVTYGIWNEFTQNINRDNVTSKGSLIAELKSDVRKIRLDVVRESCSIWTNSLYRMTQSDGNYLRE